MESHEKYRGGGYTEGVRSPGGSGIAAKAIYSPLPFRLTHYQHEAQLNTPRELESGNPRPSPYLID